MHGQYQPYQPYQPPMPPGPPYPPARRPPDRANLVPVLIIIGVVVVALLGTLAYLASKVLRDDDNPGGTTSVVRPPSPYDAQSVSDTFAGVWTGDGYYQNAKKEKRRFTASITLLKGGRTGTVNYTGFVCTGVLRVDSVTSNKIVLIETITQGAEPGGNCENASSGYVTLSTRGAGSVLYQWFSRRSSMDSGNTSSQGTLTRQQPGT